MQARAKAPQRMVTRTRGSSKRITDDRVRWRRRAGRQGLSSRTPEHFPAPLEGASAQGLRPRAVLCTTFISSTETPALRIDEPQPQNYGLE